MAGERMFGEPVHDWRPPARPERPVLAGRYVRLEPLRMEHANDLHAANSVDIRIFDYLPYGPFDSEGEYRDWVAWAAAQDDPQFFALVDMRDEMPKGVASFLRIMPEAGSIEVGHICLSALIQRTSAATEAMYLMMRWAFMAGYRRYEWKCDALNRPSRAAAQRLGLSYEGVFRQATVVKGRNRDTAWFAAIDKEWPALRNAFDTWLDPANFTEDGMQIRSLSSLTAPVLVATDPALD